MPAAVASPTALPSQQSDSIPALTSLRFIAAFAVVVLHYRDLLGDMPAWLLRGIVGGQYGVTFFFILSGFILTYKYQSWFANGVTDAGYWRFQRFRLARIYPIYVLGLLLDTPWHVLERYQVGQLSDVAQTYWASWLMNLIGLQAWVPSQPFAMFWNTPAWSVAAEFFFYATFPFVTASLTRRIRSAGGLIAAFFAVIVLGTLLYALVIHAMVYRLNASSQTQYIVMVYNPLLRYSEFLAGCLAGQYFLRTRAQPRCAGAAIFASSIGRDAVTVVCLVLIAARIWSPDYTGPSAQRWLADVSMKYTVFILPFSALIVALASGPSRLGRLLDNRALILLGEASYALYIVHWSVTTFLRMHFLGAYETPFVHGLFLLGTVALSVVCYRYVEVPWRRRLRGPKSVRSAKSQPDDGNVGERLLTAVPSNQR
ncbi:MAG: acyltransferase [Rhizobacter sp.]